MATTSNDQTWAIISTLSPVFGFIAGLLLLMTYEGRSGAMDLGGVVMGIFIFWGSVAVGTICSLISFVKNEESILAHIGLAINVIAIVISLKAAL